MYPNPYSRTPGDIDVWIDASRDRIMEYAQKKFELGDDIRLQHLETSLGWCACGVVFLSLLHE